MSIECIDDNGVDTYIEPFAFEVLRRTLIDNNCSVALSKSGISVFDTATYTQTGKFDGITVDINSLVRED